MIERGLDDQHAKRLAFLHMSGYPVDLLLPVWRDYAVRRTFVIDEDDREWHDDVWVLPPGTFRRCTAVRGLVRYPAVRLLGGASRPPGCPGGGLVWPLGNPGRAARKSTAANEKDALSVNRTRPLPVRARTVESAGTGH